MMRIRWLEIGVPSSSMSALAMKQKPTSNGCLTLGGGVDEWPLYLVPFVFALDDLVIVKFHDLPHNARIRIHDGAV